MSAFERATEPVDAFIARRSGQVQIRGWSRRSLPDYIFKGSRRNHYYIVECKGTQSAKSAAISQLQRGSEQVVTVDIAPPARVTRLVIASWLQQGITIFVIDPDSKSEPQTLSRWSIEEISTFAHAKQLSYMGDHKSAALLLQGIVEPTQDLVLGERTHQTRETGFGTYLGAEQSITTPDGHLVRMFRGIQADFREAQLIASDLGRAQLQSAVFGWANLRSFEEPKQADKDWCVHSICETLFLSVLNS